MSIIFSQIYKNI